nr:hypothetical protein [Frankia sp. ArI3]
MRSTQPYSSAEPEQEAGDQIGTGIERTGPIEGQHTVGERLGPHAQPTAAGQRGERGVRHPTDPELQGRTIDDQGSDPLPDRPPHLVTRSHRRL